MERILSALADPERLALYAAVVVADGADPDGLDPRAVRKHLGRLMAAGLVKRGADGLLVGRAEVFQEALREAAERRAGDHGPLSEPPARLTGFFRHGRLVSVPVRPAVRRELLEYLVEALLEPGRDLSEAEVNTAFRTVHEDVAALRRYCVIDGLLARTRDGSSYRRATLSV
ncbi:DUF2087 domain-containing protein [Streptomyces sp. NPDC060194]|uniref:DUF2087 domain-containing protein n=1 Tax=Streptomyces sp. NPDC060194 TaxID=3347069 RepID=UPI003665E691